MNQQQIFRGTGTALITPFRENGNIDWDSLERIIDFQVENGVNYLVSLGTTGEAIPLSSKECQEVLDFTVAKVAGRLPVVAGYFGANSTYHLLERIKNVNLEGYSAILSSSPSYNKPSQEGIYQHYMKAAEVTPVPIILYNVPSRTSSNVAPETFVRLAKAGGDRFVGVKEASGNLVQAQYIIKHRPSDNFLVISGDDQITLGMLGCGGDGVISVISNAYPQEWAAMVRSALSGDYATARQLNNQLHDIHPLLYCEGNPVGIKAAMAIKGFCANELRLPLTPLSQNNYEKLALEIQKAQK
jgi:4-hydroxy-tetrahydrodipicolinate synthase